jgi:5-amino-6-(5-phosphoribosylamino)uracil reductase
MGAFSERFERYARKREAEALAATIPGYVTRVERPPASLVSLGNDWTRTLFDGPFYRSDAPPRDGLPIVNLVFVQSRDGNTVADDPSELGGGDTDKHLVYEGLARVDADAVLSGAGTARSRSLVLSVWHPELVRLRRSLGKPRHPMQIVVTASGDLPIEDGLMYQEPALRTTLIATSAAVRDLRERLRASPWVELIDAGEPLSMTRALRELRARGVATISAIGGRRTAQAMLEERTIADVYLTTSAIEAGTPNTPFYSGPPLPLELVIEKAGTGPESGVRFEHFCLRR